jgi:uncharacterized RDD family membrane protein YckC
MHWYYEGPNGQEGPVTEERIVELVGQGAIQGATLVWHEGMEGWRSYAEVAGQGLPPSQGVCTECGRTFPEDDLIPYGGSRVCAECKPVFLQKIREGVQPVMGFAYAGFWLRLGAKIIDWIILYAANMIVTGILGFALGVSGAFDADSGPSAGYFVFQAVNLLVGIIIPAAYTTWLLGKYGATVGKMACKIRVVKADGSSISYLRALGRYFAEWISGMILLIGYIMAAFDSEKRTLHDRICNTRVIMK